MMLTFIIYKLSLVFVLKYSAAQEVSNSANIMRFPSNGTIEQKKSLSKLIAEAKELDVELRVSLFEIKPFVIISYNESGHPVLSGFAVDVFETIASIVGLRYTYVIQELLLYGTHTNSGWTGVIGLLVNKKTDICIVGTALTAERRQYIDYSPNVAFAYSVYVIKNPYDQNEVKYNYYAFLNPFPSSVWLASATMTFILRLGIIISRQFHRIFAVSQFFPKNFRYPSENTISLLMRIFKSILCLEEFERDLKLSTRILVFSWNMFRFLMISIYTGVLISFLAVQQEEYRYQTIEDILESGKYKIGTVKNHWTATALEESDSGLNKQIWQAMDEDTNNFVSTFTEGLLKSCQENYAFLLGFYTLKTLEPELNCSLYPIPQPYFQTSLHFTFQKNSPFTAVFSELINQLQSTGIIQKLKEKYEEKQSESNDVIPTSAKLQETVGSFLALSLSLPVILLILTLESSYHFIRNERQKKLFKGRRERLVYVTFGPSRTKRQNPFTIF